MKKSTLRTLSIILLSALSIPWTLHSAETRNLTALSAALSSEERAEAIARLEESRDELLRQLAPLSDEAWTFKPSPDRWSAQEVVEHLLLVERTLRARIDGALAEPADPTWAEQTRGKMELILAAVPDRSQRVEAPEPLRPGREHNADMSRADLVNGYIEARAASIAFARHTSAPLKAHLTEGGPFGVLSAHHWLAIIGLHNSRHNQQVAEILADPRLPR